MASLPVTRAISPEDCRRGSALREGPITGAWTEPEPMSISTVRAPACPWLSGVSTWTRAARPSVRALTSAWRRASDIPARPGPHCSATWRFSCATLIWSWRAWEMAASASLADMATLPGLRARARTASGPDAAAAATAVSRSDSSCANGPGSSTLAKAATCTLRLSAVSVWVRTPRRPWVSGETSSSGPAAAGKAAATSATGKHNRLKADLNRVRPSPKGVSPSLSPVARRAAASNRPRS